MFSNYRKRKRRGRARGRPVFKKDVIMLDDHLFKLDLEKGIIKLSMPKGRVTLEFYSAKYHERFRGWKIGQAWLLRTRRGVFINVVLSREVEIRDPRDFIGVDLNENNVTISLPNGEFIQIITHEREVRTGYFLKRRRIQKKLKAGKRRIELLKKYGEREGNRIRDLYHKLANKIVDIAGKYGGIALENLRELRERVNYSREVNGRLHRWGFRRIQAIIEYKAKLKGIGVVYVDPAQTSSLCPICGGILSPNGHRIMKCKNCGFSADRDIIGSWNIRLKALKMWGVTVPPESQPMKVLTRGWKVSRNEIYELYGSCG